MVGRKVGFTPVKPWNGVCHNPDVLVPTPQRCCAYTRLAGRVTLR